MPEKRPAEQGYRLTKRYAEELRPAPAPVAPAGGRPPIIYDETPKPYLTNPYPYPEIPKPYLTKRYAEEFAEEYAEEPEVAPIAYYAYAAPALAYRTPTDTYSDEKVRDNNGLQQNIQ